MQITTSRPSLKDIFRQGEDMLESMQLRIQSTIGRGMANSPELGFLIILRARMDSATDPLLGESAMLEPSEAMDFKSTTLTVPVKIPQKSNSKLHDVYVVFVNPKREAHTLMIAVGAEFKFVETGER